LWYLQINLIKYFSCVLIIFESTSTRPWTNKICAFCTFSTFFICNIMTFIGMLTKTFKLEMRNILKAPAIAFLYFTKWFYWIVWLMTLKWMTTKTLVFRDYYFTLMTYISKFIPWVFIHFKLIFFKYTFLLILWTIFCFY
jgi:hypothetical protein